MQTRQEISVIATPPTVDVVDGEICVDGAPSVDVTLTPEAAIETGVKLINAGIGVEKARDG